MSTNEEYEIKLEKADEKGMLNVDALILYLPKAKKSVCEIQIPTGGFGSGFFCKIPCTEDNNILMPVLLTNHHVLTKEIITTYDKIEVILENKTKIIPLKKRKKWTDEPMDFTCIEIKPKEDNIHTFYNLDEAILDNNFSNDTFLDRKVLIFAINNNDDKQVGFSNGLIKNNKEPFFFYTCNTYPGCSGGCIVNQLNNGIIGIHRGEVKGKKLNQGIYITHVIKYIKNHKEVLQNENVNKLFNNFL